jgi:hypothetical protein
MDLTNIFRTHKLWTFTNTREKVKAQHH